MARIKIHKAGIARRTGLKGMDLQENKPYDHVAVESREVILLDEIKQLLEDAPGVTVRQLLELTQ